MEESYSEQLKEMKSKYDEMENRAEHSKRSVQKLKNDFRHQGFDKLLEANSTFLELTT